MNVQKRILAIALLASSIVACGRQVGSVPFSGEGTKSATLPLTAGGVAFWTDLDVAYEGSGTLSYRIELSQAGRTIATTTCDPLGKMSVQLGWLDIQRGASHSSSGHGKMLCGATLAKGGSTLVQATLAFGVRPLTATIKQADLVVKQ
jgi:hypothetical protein